MKTSVWIWAMGAAWVSGCGGVVVDHGGEVTEGDAGGGGAPDAGEQLEPAVAIDCGELATTTSNGSTSIGLAFPPGSYLAWVSVQVIPPQSHAAMPAELPVVELFTAPAAAGGILATTIDPSPDLASYETPHRVIAMVDPAGPGYLPAPGVQVYGHGIGEGIHPGTVFDGWICYVRLGTCVDPGTGAPLPDGTPCGMVGSCTAGACGG